MVLDLCDAGSFTHNQGGHFCWKSHVSNDQAKKCFFFRGFCLGYWDGSYRGTMWGPGRIRSAVFFVSTATIVHLKYFRC